MSLEDTLTLPESSDIIKGKYHFGDFQKSFGHETVIWKF